MPTIIETKVFEFSELDDAAKEKARDWWRECENQEFDTEFMYDDFVRMGALLGIEINTRAVPLMNGKTRPQPTIFWSGFSSQGDGACFEGSYAYAKGAAKAIAKETGGTEKVLIDIAKRMQALQSRYFYGLTAEVKHSGHYYHEWSMSIDVYDRNGDGATAGVHDEMRTLFADFARWMYRQLEKEHEYRMSNEAVDESIEANGYTFTEKGRRFG